MRTERNEIRKEKGNQTWKKKKDAGIMLTLIHYNSFRREQDRKIEEEWRRKRLDEQRKWEEDSKKLAEVDHCYFLAQSLQEDKMREFEEEKRRIQVEETDRKQRYITIFGRKIIFAKERKESVYAERMSEKERKKS
jgi:hypothetical protein